MAARRSNGGNASHEDTVPTEPGDPAAPAVDQVAPASASLSTVQAPEDPLIGQVIAERYRVDQLLGVGGMGCVYRGEHVRMKKAVALKVLHRRMTFVPEAVARFEREAIAAARIQHPNVAAASDFGHLPDGTLYMVLEFVEGRNLRDIIREQGAMPTARAVKIVTQMAEALSAAHEQGVVHRDLKPENVMLTGSERRGLVKVLDFGIAKLSMQDSEGGKLTQLGTVCGTPDYMSPEQAAGQPVDHRADLYALGLVFYELLTGSAPFSGPAVLVLTKQLNEPPPPLPDGTDARVARIVMRLLEKDPEARPATAEELLEELRALRFSIWPARVRRGSAGQRHGVKLGERAGDALRRMADKASLALYRLYRLFEPPVLAVWRRAFRRFPKLSILQRRVRIGGVRFRIWGLCAFGALVLGVALLFVFARDQAPEKATPRPLPAPAPSASKPVEVVKPAEMRVSDDEFQDALSVPAYKRKRDHWLTLGHAHLEREQWSEATAAYRNAVQLDKVLARDPEVLGGLRTLAERHESYKTAINATVSLLGDSGMDLLYDLWDATKDDSGKRPIAELAHKKLAIYHQTRGSDALKSRLALEFADKKNCKKIAKLVEKAIGTADRRSLRALTDLKGKLECASGQEQDCYPCLRETSDLNTALQTAGQRAAPSFADGKYVPAD